MSPNKRTFTRSRCDYEKEISTINLLIVSVLVGLQIRKIPINSQIRKIPLLGGDSHVNSEIQDRKIYVIYLLIVIFFVFLIFTQKKILLSRNSSNALSFVALITIFSATMTTNNYLDYKGTLWFGFGAKVALSTLFFIILIHKRYSSALGIHFSFSPKVSLFFWMIFIVIYLPSFLQFSSGVIDLDHSLYIFNEMSAPLANKFPLSNFTSQYGALMGYPLLVIKAIDKKLIITFLPYWTSLLTVLSIFAVAFTMKRLFRDLPFGIALVFPTCLILVKHGSGNSQWGSLAQLTSALPVRTLLPIICGLTLVIAIQKSFSRVFLVLLGIFAGLCSINNFEFGFTAAFALFITVTTLCLLSYVSFRNTIWVLFGFTFSIGAFTCLLQLSGNSMQPSRWSAFSVGFNNGFGSVEMPNFGTYVLVFCVLSIGVVGGLFRLSSANGTKALGGNTNSVASSALALYAGSWGIFCLPYYVARSINSGQLQIFLIPVTLVIIGVLANFCNLDKSKLLIVKIPIFKKTSMIRNSPLLFIFCLPLASLLQFPLPSVEWQRLISEGETFSASSLSDWEVVRQIKSYKLGNQNSSIGVITNFSNLVSIASETTSIIELNDLSDIQIDEHLKENFCESINRSRVEFMIVDGSLIGTLELSNLCELSNFRYQESYQSLNIYKFEANE